MRCGNGGCAQGCENNVGGFACSCNDGFVLGDDGFSCRDLNVCGDGIPRRGEECDDGNALTETCHYGEAVLSVPLIVRSGQTSCVVMGSSILILKIAMQIEPMRLSAHMVLSRAYCVRSRAPTLRGYRDTVAMAP